MEDDDDDLGAFFEEVSAAEEDAKKELGEKTDATSSNELGLVSDNNGLLVHYDVPPIAPPAETKAAATTGSAVVIKREAVITKRESSIYATSHHGVNRLSATGASASHFLPLPPPPPPLLSENATFASSLTYPQQQHQLYMNHNQAPPLPPGLYPTMEQQQYQHNESMASNKKKKGIKRTAAGKTWVDPSLADWPENDYRLFVGNLAKDVKNEHFFQHFQSKYPSVAAAKIMVDKNKDNQSRGYGFVSFLDPLEAARAMREMNETFLGSRPIKVKKSEWHERDLNTVKKKQKKKF